jgi:serine/threonine-protein kinase
MDSSSGSNASTPQPPTRPLRSFENRRVGPYLLQSEAGRGGMGSVWLAIRDDGQYQGRVAIKMLANAWLGHEAEQRFRQEGTLLARLSHPNIARLLDAGVTAQGEPYLVLEYVEGEPIDAYCNRAGLDISARIELFIDLLGAVAHAHRNLIVHRDLKPANVLVDAAGKIKLLDFGISKLLEQQDPMLTRTGHTLMTPQYAAPEQLLGAPVTTAVDVYALGLLLYLLLTGRLPYSATNSPVELMRLITTGVIPLPSRVATELRPHLEHPRGRATLRRQLRGDLDNIVLKAVHAAPEQRYQDVAAFAADLQRYLSHQPVSARAATPLYRLGKFVRRNRTGAIATFLVLLSMTVGGIFSLTQWLEAQRQRDIARSWEVSTGLISDFIDFAAQSDGGPDRAPLTMAEHLERSAASIEKRFARDPRFAGELLLQIATSLPKLSAATQLSMLERVYTLASNSNDGQLMGYALCMTARIQAMTGQAEDASVSVQRAQRQLAQLKRTPMNLRAHCLVAEGLVEQSRANHDRAVTLVREAAGILERGGMPDRAFYAKVLSSLTWVYAQGNNPAAAIEATLESARIEAELGVTDTTEHLQNMQNLAALRMQVGEIGPAAADCERIRQLSRKFYTAQDIQPMLIYNSASASLRMERPKDALAILTGQVERLRHAGDPAMLLRLLHAQAWTHIQLREWTAAEVALAEMQPLLEQGVASTAFHSVLELLHADVAIGRQDATATREHVKKALSMSGYERGVRDRAVAHVLMAASRLALAQGQPAAAERYARDALSINEAIARGPDSSADVGEALLMLAKSKSGSATRAELQDILERALRCLNNALNPQHRLTLEARRMLEKL